MGTKDRKDREKEQLKDLILTAAREIFIVKGYDQTSIRNIADRIEYSPGTIYLYFKDKDSIFHELHKEGFMLMKQQMAVLEMISDPFERLKTMGRIYLDFAKKHPDYYDLMFIIMAPMKALENPSCWNEGQSAFDMLVQVVAACSEQGQFKGQDVEDLAYMIWATVHGMASISIRERCHVVSEAKQDKIESLGLEAFFQLLSKS